MSDRLLIVDDEEGLLEFLSLLFQDEGYEPTMSNSAERTRELLKEQSFDVVLCDITMPDGSGLDLLREIKRDFGDRTAVIMMTAYSSAESAIDSMKLGAYDYVSKPFDVEELKLLVEKAREKAKLLDENRYLRQQLEERYAFDSIVGRSPRMRQLFGLIERVARTPSTVLIRGESGTGKELFARAIHQHGQRADRRFLSINCGALPENLLESELFGHVRGAFTGAVRDKRGLFQEASGGTLFLDEIGEMDPAIQVKLLRALQEKVVRRVGGTQEESVDVRIIAATNQNLESRIADGSFREDLFYRVNVIPIQLPPLRDRNEDIPLLIDHFVRKFSTTHSGAPKQFSTEALRLMESYDWPGNVRELENVVERSLALTVSEVIEAADLPPTVRFHSKVERPFRLPDEGLDLEAFLEQIRTQLMTEALERTEGVQTQAAELLGMSFRSFRYYAKKSGLTVKTGEA